MLSEAHSTSGVDNCFGLRATPCMATEVNKGPHFLMNALIRF